MTASESTTKKAHGLGTPLEGTPAPPWDPAAPIAAPLCLYRPTVLPEWVDYNGHMSESCYLLVFGDNSDAFFRLVGIDEAYRDQGGYSLYTVQTHIHNIREVAEGEPLRLTLQLLDFDDKRVHIFHAMHHGASDDLLATGEQMLVHVDIAQGRATPMPADLRTRLHAIAQAHASLPTPAQVGKPMGIRRKTA
ncbi:MAG: thioesterase family protein [Rhodoferax sp.]|nr:thioesterase family protein [Rhodoferax sp.]